MRPDDHDGRADDLTRRRLLEAIAGTAGITGGVAVVGATGGSGGGTRDRDRPGRSVSGCDEAAPPTGSLTAVVDRLEGDRAVLVLERDGETAGELVTDAGDLPDDGRHADAVLEVTLCEGRVVSVEYDPAATEARAESAQRRFERLSRRPDDVAGKR